MSLSSLINITVTLWTEKNFFSSYVSIPLRLLKLSQHQCILLCRPSFPQVSLPLDSLTGWLPQKTPPCQSHLHLHIDRDGGQVKDAVVGGGRTRANNLCFNPITASSGGVAQLGLDTLASLALQALGAGLKRAIMRPVLQEVGKHLTFAFHTDLTTTQEAIMAREEAEDIFGHLPKSIRLWFYAYMLYLQIFKWECVLPGFCLVLQCCPSCWPHSLCFPRCHTEVYEHQ